MSEEVTQPEPGSVNPDGEPHGTPPVTDGDTLGADPEENSAPLTSSEASASLDWKAHARTWENRARGNQKTIELLTSEKETLAESLAEAQASQHKAEAQLLRLTVAHETGLPLEMTDRLVGETKEELVEDAERLKALFAGVNQPVQGSPVIVPGVPTGGDVFSPTDAAAIAANMP